MRILHGHSPNAYKVIPGDHAGILETSLMEACYPGSIRPDRLDTTEDWYAEGAENASAELGERALAATVEEYLPLLRNEV